MTLRLSLALVAGIACFAGVVNPPAVTPEPATFVLVGGGILLAAGLAKYRKSRR